MPRLLVSLLFVLLSAAAVAAQEGEKRIRPAWNNPPARPWPIALVTTHVDKDKLRAAVCMPEISMMLKMLPAWHDSNPLRRRMVATDPVSLDNAALAAELEKRLDGSTRDVEVYLDLAACYARLKDTERKNAAYRKAEEVLRPHLLTSDPKDARLLAQAARLQRCLDVHQLDRMFALAERAVELAPADWYCWEELGWVRRDEVIANLYGGAANTPQSLNSLEMVRELSQSPLSPGTIAAAEHSRDEARHCFDRVERFCARDPQAISACVQYDLFELALLVPLFPRGRDFARALPRDAPLVRRGLALAELCPDDGVAQEQAALYLLATAKHPKIEKPCEAVTMLPESDRQLIAVLLGRVEKAAEAADPSLAARYHHMVVVFQLSMMDGDMNIVERNARKAVALDGSRAEAWEALALSLNEQGRFGEAADVAEEYARRLATPRSSLFFAHALLYVDWPKKAERVIRAALRKSPDDLACTLALVALLLQRSDRADTLVEAEAQLERTRTMKFQEYGVWRDYHLLRAALLGLTDKADEAVGVLRPFIEREPNNKRVSAVRAAFSP